MPGGLLLPCDLDEVQGGQARPPLVPKHFSRLLPHKARTGPLSGGGSTTLRTGPRAEGDNGPRPRGTSQPPPVRGPGTEVSRGGTPSLTPRGSRPGRLQADTCQQGVRLSSRLVNRSHGNAPPKSFLIVQCLCTGCRADVFPGETPTPGRFAADPGKGSVTPRVVAMVPTHQGNVHRLWRRPRSFPRGSHPPARFFFIFRPISCPASCRGGLPTLLPGIGPARGAPTSASARPRLRRGGRHGRLLLSPLFKRPVKRVQTFPPHGSLGQGWDEGRRR